MVLRNNPGQRTTQDRATVNKLAMVRTYFTTRAGRNLPPRATGPSTRDSCGIVKFTPSASPLLK
eukprot:8572094-Lingulodinium_polyedra.AAC.1